MPFSLQEQRLLPIVISAPRFARYLRARRNDPQAALELYRWNMEVSAAFMVPLHLCEVAMRNGVIEAILQVHGPNWPRKKGFIQSLPRPSDPRQYDPARNLAQVAARHMTNGKVVADLNFAFWEKLFTAGQESRLWLPHFRSTFPGAPPGTPISSLRQTAFNQLQRVRQLRNRIAHHEPIFARVLTEDYQRISELVTWRCPVTAAWMNGIQAVTSLLTQLPP